MAYKYRVFLKRSKHENPVTPKKPFSFTAPVSEEEKIILPAHHKNLKDMPEWVQNQSLWVVLHVIHSPDKGSSNFLILTPAESILSELIFSNMGPESDITIH